MVKTMKEAKPMAKDTKPPFNKGDLIEFVAKQTNLPKTQAKNAVEAVLDGIKKNAKRDVRIVGFGSFAVVKRKARKGFNPKTGQKMDIKPSRTVKFRPGQAFKSSV